MSNVSLKVALQGIPGALDAWLEVHSEEDVRAEILALVSPMETLRDKFAGRAMQAMLGSEFVQSGKGSFESISETSYVMADAMLAAREAQP